MNICAYVKSRSEAVTSYQKVDLVDPEKLIRYFKQNNKFSNLLTPKSNRALQIKFHGTPATVQAFRHSHSFHANSSNRGIKYDCLITIDGLDVTGRAILYLTKSNVDVKEDKLTLNGFLIYGRGLWIDDLDEIKVVDLDLGSHYFDLSTIENSQNRQGDFFNAGYDAECIGGVYLPLNCGGAFTGGIGSAGKVSPHVDDLRLHLYCSKILLNSLYCFVIDLLM